MRFHLIALFAVLALLSIGCPPPGVTPPIEPPPPPPPPPPGCGDGVVGDVEDCDDGNLGNGPGQCRADCTYPICGDGIIDIVSANYAVADGCDDGNNLPGDGCSPACQDEILAPPYLTINGAVRNREYRVPNFLDNVTVRIINAHCPPDDPLGQCVSTPSAVTTGAYSIAQVPTNAALIMQASYPETFDIGAGPVNVPPGFATRFKAYTEAGAQQTIDMFVLRYNSVAQIATDCGVYADLNTALSGDAEGDGGNDWLVYSAFFGQVKDATGTAVAGIDKNALYVRLGEEINDVTTRNNASYFCWLDQDPANPDKLVGTQAQTSNATGYFMVFKARNNVNATGVGNAYVGLAPNPVVTVPEVSVPVNAGQIGVVTLNEDPNLNIDVPRSFTNDVYPLFYQQLGCTNCHYNGGIGYQGPNQLDFTGNAQQVYDKLTGNGTVCNAPLDQPGEYPVCLNDPARSLVLLKPLLGYAEENGINPADWHPNASFQDLNDANFVAIKQWLEQGAYNDYNVVPPPVGGTLDVVIQEVAARGCIACHDAAAPSGGMPLNGCIAGFDYAAVGVDPDSATNPNYKQDCVYYHLKNQDVLDDPFGFGKRVNPGSPEDSMLLYNAYCGPNGANICNPPETHPLRVWPDRDNDATYQAILLWIQNGANNDYAAAP